MITNKDGDAKVQRGDDLVEAKADGSSTVKNGEGDEVKTDADGTQTIKSGDKEVKVGKDGKIEISGVPGL